MHDIGRTIVVVGAGIAGLCSALALSRAGFQVQLLEQTRTLKDVGAGIQLGPNATKILSEWGLGQALQTYASQPADLSIHDMINGQTLAQKNLFPDMQKAFGAPYLTLHRADLQYILQQALFAPAVQAYQYAPRFALGQGFCHFAYESGSFLVHANTGEAFAGAILLGADGLWSKVRAQTLGASLPRYSGYVAYRACLPQATLPKHLQRFGVELWMGPKMHMVVYPIRANTMLNMVLVRPEPEPEQYGDTYDNIADWEAHQQVMPNLPWLQPCCTEIQDLLQAAQQLWTRWPLFDRPMCNAHGIAPIPGQALALIGDAAHPMRPFLAQGAGMAIEDAHTLTRFLSLAMASEAYPHAAFAQALQDFAQHRFPRVAKVQQRSGKKAGIYHATGLVRQGRNALLRSMAPWLLQQDWLYRYP